MLRLLITTILAAFPAVLLAQGAEISDASKELFITKCSSCHSLGEGDRVGPDLKGVTGKRSADWLSTMIKTPSALLDTDPEARKLLASYNNVRMPDLGLADGQVADLIATIEFCSANTCELTPELRPVMKATTEDATQGRALFLGRALLENGGPSCISCHTVVGAGAMIGGGTLARELTHVFARLGDAGLDAALRNAHLRADEQGLRRSPDHCG